MCGSCRRAKTRYEKVRLLAGGHLKVSSLGTRRRIQALRALGYSLDNLAQAGGWQSYHAAFKYPMVSETITAGTAERVAALYERLSMTLATGPRADQLRAAAQRNGWLVPLAWDDIDNDPETCKTRAISDNKDICQFDHAVVHRILAGDMTLAAVATRAERQAVVDGWGRSLAELRRLTGWKPERYGRPDAVA